jgi:16S rRNA C1402 (ribose-2'-O) methylase RsmI
LQELETLHFAGSLLIARELSKMHEQYFVGTIQETKDAVKNKTIPLK